MFDNGLLVLHASNALNRISPVSVVQRCSQLIQKTLYVHLINDDVEFTDIQNHTPSVPLVQGVRGYITDFYTSASCLGKSLDVRFLLSNISVHPISTLKPLQLRHGYDVIITDFSSDQHQNLQSYVATMFPSSSFETKVLQGLAELADSEVPVEKVAAEVVETYDFVGLGGTFDRLHLGHKILLSEGCLLCDKALTVGVTDGDINKSEILPELMQSTPDRICAICDFLFDVKPSIDHQVIQVTTDIYDPSIKDSSLQCLICMESIRGWELVNAKRTAQGLAELKLNIIELSQDMGHIAEEGEKVRSSSSRIELLGTLLRKPKVEVSYDRRPFVIGLTGGAASGKTSVGNRLQQLGAGVIDCDALGHVSCLPGSPGFEKMVEAFGKDIIDSHGFIDQRILNSKLVASQEDKAQYNEIIWPAVLRLVTEEVQLLADKGTEVVVMEASDLLEAQWDLVVDETWITLIPQTEALNRLMKQNSWTREDAEQKLVSQISNEDWVSRADVILSTLWTPEITQKQNPGFVSLERFDADLPLQQNLSPRSRPVDREVTDEQNSSPGDPGLDSLEQFSADLPVQQRPVDRKASLANKVMELNVEVLAKTELPSSTIAVVLLHGDLTVLRHPRSGYARLHIFKGTSASHLKITLELEEVQKPLSMSVCNYNNCIYIIHKEGSFLCILKLRYENDNFVEKLPLLKGSPHYSVYITPQGKLNLLYRDFPKYLLVCSDTGETESKIYLPEGVPLVNHVLGRENGDFILVSSEDSRTRFTVINQEGVKMHSITCCEVSRYNCTVDIYDRLVLLMPNKELAVCDTVLSRMPVVLQEGHCTWQGNAKLSYDSEGNQLVIYDCEKLSAKYVQWLVIAKLNEVYETGE